MDGTFDLFDRHCDGQNGLHTHFVRQRNICYKVTESHDVKEPLGGLISVAAARAAVNNCRKVD